MTLLVVMETQCGSVWIYPVESKGTLTEQWLPRRIALDLETIGLGTGVRIIVKNDQERAIVDLRNKIVELRSSEPAQHAMTLEWATPTPTARSRGWSGK